ncbi:glycosyltransferase [Streptomyces sp. CBMA152]|uniref:glycosyltransferase n=1 Tax=Streptomyces sp. CBMA152 TaxID=1896312 RepID=UPI00166163AA|nr:glycosyltransferase [Streptomyces sp. CBMA152]MBD0744985.1 glycosyl transferase [Streptomyces sp. CBMA152]
MKVLHVITGLGIGGAEQQLRLMLRQLPAGAEVVTLTNPGAVAEGLAADGVRVHHLGMSGNRDLTALPRLTRLIRRGEYDLVHTHLYRACLYGRIAARLAGVRAIVATEHSLGATTIEGRPLGAGVRALYLAAERLGTSTVAVSATIARRLREWGVPAHRVHVVPNAVDAPRFRFDTLLRTRARALLGLPRDAYVIGGVGRLVEGKRFEVLVRALPQLPYARLLLVGSGEQETSLRALAQQLGVADRVCFAGECAYEGSLTGTGSLTLPALLAAMDVLASPSADEAFGLAVVEALAAGLPVVYVTCPAVDDLPPGDAPGAVRTDEASFADALRRVQENGCERLPVPPAVEHYTVAASTARLTAVYEAALHRPVGKQVTSGVSGESGVSVR